MTSDSVTPSLRVRHQRSAEEPFKPAMATSNTTETPTSRRRAFWTWRRIFIAVIFIAGLGWVVELVQNSDSPPMSGMVGDFDAQAELRQILKDLNCEGDVTVESEHSASQPRDQWITQRLTVRWTGNAAQSQILNRLRDRIKSRLWDHWTWPTGGSFGRGNGELVSFGCSYVTLFTTGTVAVDVIDSDDQRCTLIYYAHEHPK